MEKQIKTIGVLTSGGDAPGMNAAVRAVVRTGLHKGYRMIGIQRGYNGLLNGECFEMNLRSVSNIISAGGTILYTARCLEFKTKEGQDKGAEKCRELGIDALVVIGGDGSYRGARELAHRGIPMIGLPGTIDNDISCTDYTIGYDTAMNTALEMIDKLRDTTQSHDRCSVVEVPPSIIADLFVSLCLCSSFIGCVINNSVISSISNNPSGPRNSPAIPNSFSPTYTAPSVSKGESPICPLIRCTSRNCRIKVQIRYKPVKINAVFQLPMAISMTAHGTSTVPVPNTGKASMIPIPIPTRTGHGFPTKNMPIVHKNEVSKNMIP